VTIFGVSFWSSSMTTSLGNNSFNNSGNYSVTQPKINYIFSYITSTNLAEYQ